MLAPQTHTITSFLSESCQKEMKTTGIDWDHDDDDAMKREASVIIFNVQYVAKEVNNNFVKIK